MDEGVGECPGAMQAFLSFIPWDLTGGQGRRRRDGVPFVELCLCVFVCVCLAYDHIFIIISKNAQ